MLSRDPAAAPSPRPRPPTGTATNPALCEQCNASLHLDDSFLKPYLKTSATGEQYLGGLHAHEDFPYTAFGGIDYVRCEQVPTLPNLSLAAESGCAFCAALRKGLQDKYQGSPWWKPHPEPLTLRIQYRWTVSVDATNLDAVVVSVLHPELGEWMDRLEVLQFWAYAAGDEDPCTKWFGLESRACDNPWSPHNISMSQRWINECVDRTSSCQETIESDDSDLWISEGYDTDCQDEANATAGEGRTHVSRSAEHSSGTFLPTRLLDLSPVPAHTTGCIRLVDSIYLEKSVRYAALSYCWGDVKPAIITTKANLDSHRQDIELSALPQCLRDAVTVARGLETRYLWIDALCIIQGDGDDWARESATMCQLFQNAYVTIAAASSESFDEGFLTRRPFEAFDMNISSALNPQAMGKFVLSTISELDGWKRKVRYQLPADLRTCKWDTRGWVWQEQQLSKRLLVFGKQMLHFKCDHGMRSEASHDMRNPSRLSEACRGSWTQCLRDYTPKHFTFLQDKLPAVSGLAKQIDQNSTMRGEGPAQYLAGIWYCSERRKPGKGWQHQLFWRLESPSQSFQEMLERLKSNDPRTYTAPSWSWASRGEGASWDSPYLQKRISVCPSRFEAKIEDHQMNLTGPDPTGRVGPGSYLKLSGLLHPDPLDLSAFEKDGFAFMWTLSDQTSFLFINPDWNHSPTDQEDPLFECDIRLFGLWRSQWEDSEYSDRFRGLLLLRDCESGLYLRVGSFEMGGKGQDYERWERQSIYIL